MDGLIQPIQYTILRHIFPFIFQDIYVPTVINRLRLIFSDWTIIGLIEVRYKGQVVTCDLCCLVQAIYQTIKQTKMTRNSAMHQINTIVSRLGLSWVIGLNITVVLPSLFFAKVYYKQAQSSEINLKKIFLRSSALVI